MFDESGCGESGCRPVYDVTPDVDGALLNGRAHMCILGSWLNVTVAISTIVHVPELDGVGSSRSSYMVFFPG